MKIAVCPSSKLPQGTSMIGNRSDLRSRATHQLPIMGCSEGIKWKHVRGTLCVRIKFTLATHSCAAETLVGNATSGAHSAELSLDYLHRMIPSRTRLRKMIDDRDEPPLSAVSFSGVDGREQRSIWGPTKRRQRWHPIRDDIFHLFFRDVHPRSQCIYDPLPWGQFVVRVSVKNRAQIDHDRQPDSERVRGLTKHKRLAFDSNLLLTHRVSMAIMIHSDMIQWRWGSRRHGSSRQRQDVWMGQSFPNKNLPTKFLRGRRSDRSVPARARDTRK